jgi:hypothetical protein
VTKLILNEIDLMRIVFIDDAACGVTLRLRMSSGEASAVQCCVREKT